MQGVLLALLAGALFGLSNVLARMGIARSSVYVAVVWNVFTNTTLFTAGLLGLYVMGKLPGISWASVPFFAGAGVLIDLAGRSSLYATSARLGASRASAFRVVAPIVTLTAGIVFLGEYLTWRAVLGVALMLSGIGVVTFDAMRLQTGNMVEAAAVPPSLEPEGAASPEVNLHKQGLLFGAAAAVCFGIGDIARKQGIMAEPFALFGAAVSGWTGLLFYTGIGVKRGGLHQLFKPGKALPFLLGAGLFTGAAVVTFLSSMRFIPVGVATTINGTQALFAVLFGWLINRKAERVTVLLAVGVILALLGLRMVVQAS